MQCLNPFSETVDGNFDVLSVENACMVDVKIFVVVFPLRK